MTRSHTGILLTSPSSRVAILRGGGRHAAVLWELIVPIYDEVFVWDDSKDMERLHPLLRGLPQFSLTRIVEYESFDCFVAIGSSSLRKDLAVSVMSHFYYHGTTVIFTFFC